MSPPAERPALIVGAGIAGLAAARALTRRGIACEIVEQGAARSTEGAGLFTCANGLAALDRLGLGDAVRHRGVEITERRMESSRGRLLASIPESAIWGAGRTSLGITRPALLGVLAAGAGETPISYGCSIDSLRSGPDGVDVAFTDGRQARYGIVVGADGQHSVVRRLLLGAPPTRRVADRVVRFLATRPDGLDAWTLRAHRAGVFLMVPVSADQLYCYVSRQAGSDDLDLRSWMAPFGAGAAPVTAILDQWSPERSFVDSIDELEQPTVWGRGRIALIGDAVHAMAPFMAQGSSLAAEDALTLADLAATGETAWPALAERLTAARAARTAWVRARNRRRERLTALPVSVAKLALRLGGAKSWIADLAPLADHRPWPA